MLHDVHFHSDLRMHIHMHFIMHIHVPTQIAIHTRMQTHMDMFIFISQPLIKSTIIWLVDIHSHMHMHMHIHVHFQIHTHTHTHVHLITSVCSWPSPDVMCQSYRFTCIVTCTCMYMCMYIHILHTHTYMYTHANVMHYISQITSPMWHMAQYLSNLADDRLRMYSAQFSTYDTRRQPMQVQHADDSKYALVTHVLHDVF